MRGRCHDPEKMVYKDGQWMFGCLWRWELSSKVQEEELRKNDGTEYGD